MIKKIKNLLQVSSRYPYQGLFGKSLLLDYLTLKLSPVFSFPKMNIIPLVKDYYNLKSNEEFDTGYRLSHEGFQELWQSKSRENKEAVESFYQEHDKDIWRQAWLSRYGYGYKKKILGTMHIVRRAVPRNGRILDYGCGAGAVGGYIASKGYAVDALDIPSKTLDFVRTEMGDRFKDIITAGTRALKEKEYDLVITLDALEHTLDPLNIVKDILKSLKPSGLLYISFPKETDFSLSHTRKAQEERPKVFKYLSQTCEVLVSELIYRHRT